MELAERTAATLGFLAKDPVRAARVAPSPHAVVHRQGCRRLLYFAPDAAPQHPPVFVSMPLINRWFIWDLMPGHSVIATLTAAGVPVYLLDWGEPGPEERTRPLSELIDGVLVRAMDRALRHATATTGATTFDAVGYCVGGTFLAVALSRLPAHLRAAVRRSVFVATPIDFHASGRLAAWARPDNFPLDSAIDGLGNYPGKVIKDAFAWLRPEGQARKWVSLWERIDKEGFPTLWAALERWSEDPVDFPGEAYREYVRSCYFDNTLMTPGAWRLGGIPVDLAAAKMPTVSIAAKGDHIVPAPAAHALAKVWGGPVRTREIPGGHVGVCVNGALAAALVEEVTA